MWSSKPKIWLCVKEIKWNYRPDCSCNSQSIQHSLCSLHGLIETWCAIDLQCSFTFKCIAKWFSNAHTHILSQILFPYRLLQETEHSTLSNTVGPYWLFILYIVVYIWASLAAQLVKNLPAMRETWVWTLGWEDSPGEGKGYPLQYPGLENSSPWGCKELDTTERLSLSFHFQCVSINPKVLINPPLVNIISRCLWVCFANKFIYIIFQDSIYKWYHFTFVSHYLTYFT